MSPTNSILALATLAGAAAAQIGPNTVMPPYQIIETPGIGREVATPRVVPVGRRGAKPGAPLSDVPVPKEPVFDASDPARFGKQLAEFAELYGRGWKDEVSGGSLVHTSEAGEVARFTLSVRRIEGKTGGDKSLAEYDSARTRGRLLTHHKVATKDSHWLRLGKRVAHSVRPSVAADFTGETPGFDAALHYDELSSMRADEYEWKFLDLVWPKPGTPLLYRLEATPRSAGAPYSKLIVYLSSKTWQRERIDYYDRAGNFIKQAKASDWAHVLARFWRPKKVEVLNTRTGARSVIELTSLRLDQSLYREMPAGRRLTNLRPDQFTPAALNR